MSEHREISIAEFFEKNRHLLGFDSKTKALLTTIKEAVDNSLDACEEAKILPDIFIQIFDMGNQKFKVIVEDNGPGLDKEKVPLAFGKLLYGSKFHKLKQSRGQQGIGISAAVLYAQLTTGKPAKIISKTKTMPEAYVCSLMIDTKTNQPKILNEYYKEWNKESGIRIELELEADFSRGARAIESYLRQTAIANPHANIIYIDPKMNQFVFARATDELPKLPKEILPHPYGVELGRFIKMIHDTKYSTLLAFLTKSFSKVGEKTAKEICLKAKLDPSLDPKTLERLEIERLYKAIQETPIQMPPTDCLSPIGKENLEKGLRKELPAEYFITITRSPQVYRGNPFVIEVGLAYGGKLKSDEAMILRFANRVPLLFQKSACAITRAIKEINWKTYGLEQPKNGIPNAPLVIAVHIASVWVPFTSEAKEAIAHYPEIIKEIKLALQEAGRKLALYIGKKKRVSLELKKRQYLSQYINHLSEALTSILELGNDEKERIKTNLEELLVKLRGEVQKIEEENLDYNPEGEELIDDVEKLEQE